MSRSDAITALRARVAGWQRREAPAWPAVGFGLEETAGSPLAGGLASGALHEVLPEAPADLAAAAGFALAVSSRILRVREGHVLWICPGARGRRGGGLYPVGLAGFDIDPGRVVQVEASRPRDLLWSLEEALSHGSLAAVIGILADGDRSYDFTVSRRLSMRAAQSGATALLLGSRCGLDMATAAQTRWSVASGTSAPAQYTGQAVPGLGPPRWQVRLVKSRANSLGLWDLEWNHETLSFRLAAPLAGRAPLHRPAALVREPSGEHWSAA
ncbi:ImuA family protein [Stappia sp.]|uniref:ImuA family protein n=1 Tax=Stappia sp. TaxID=1870903 RepID=UPI003A995ACC